MSGYLLIENPETGEEVEVEYTIQGRFSRATLYDPAEYPEVEFENLPSWADESDLAQQALEQAREDASSDAAEARYEAMRDRYDDW